MTHQPIIIIIRNSSSRTRPELLRLLHLLQNQRFRLVDDFDFHLLPDEANHWMKNQFDGDDYDMIVAKEKLRVDDDY